MTEFELVEKLDALVTKNHVTIRFKNISGVWVGKLLYLNESNIHRFYCKKLKDLLMGIIENIETKYK